MWRTDDVWTNEPYPHVVLAANRGSKGAKAELARRAAPRVNGLDLAVSPGGRPINYSSLDRSPKKNWVEKKGGLPPYVRGVARGIARSRGHATPTSSDIAMAIAAMKRWARGGDDVKPAVRAAAAKAVARWTAMKGADLSTVDMTDLDFARRWTEALHPRDHRGRFARKNTGLLKKAIEFGRSANPDDFEVQGGAYRDGTGGNVYINKDGQYAGHISWSHTGEIRSIDVRSDLRRKGVGTMLALLAREQDPAVHHSEVLTPAGKAFEEGTNDILGLMPEALRPEMRRKTAEKALWAVAAPEVKRDKKISLEERAAIRKKLLQHPVKSKHIVSTFHEATEGEMQAGLNWYRNANKVAKAMAKRHGVDVRTAAGLLAVYSPQTPWGQNALVANEVLRNKQPVGGPGAHVVVDVDALDEVNEKRRGVMSPAIRRAQAKRLLEGEEMHDVFAPLTKTGKRPPKSLKIRAFGELIANGGQTEDGDLVVIDRHAAGVARGIRLEDNDFEVDGPSASGKKYKVYADAYRQAAKALSLERGETITAEQVQAVTWLVRQRLNNAVRARKSLGNRDAREALNYFAQYDPDIAEIFGGGMVGYAELSNVHEEDR